MEFTKTEKRILDPKHEKREKVVLWVAILFFCISIALIPFSLNQLKKITLVWEQAYDSLDKNVVPATKQEAALKEILLKTTTDEKELWLKYITEKSFRVSIVAFFIGCFLIGSYFRSRIYTRLIRKYQKILTTGSTADRD